MARDPVQQVEQCIRYYTFHAVIPSWRPDLFYIFDLPGKGKRFLIAETYDDAINLVHRVDGIILLEALGDYEYAHRLMQGMHKGGGYWRSIKLTVRPSDYALFGGMSRPWILWLDDGYTYPFQLPYWNRLLLKDDPKPRERARAVITTPRRMTAKDCYTYRGRLYYPGDTVEDICERIKPVPTGKAVRPWLPVGGRPV